MATNQDKDTPFVKEELDVWPLQKGQFKLIEMLGKDIVSKISEIEMVYFNKSPLDAIQMYKDIKTNDESTKTFLDLWLARLYQRLGLYKEAHKLVEKHKELHKDLNTEEKQVMYLEWVLISKKIYYK